jgi:hypothetical protein
LAWPSLVQAAFSAGVQVFEQPDLAAPALSLQLAFAAPAFLSAQQAFTAGASLSLLTFSVVAFWVPVTFWAETVVTVNASTRVISEMIIAIFFIFEVVLVVQNLYNAKVTGFIGKPFAIFVNEMLKI